MSIHLPSKLHTLDEAAFFACTSLVDVRFPAGLAIIGAYRAGPDGTDVGAAYVFKEEEDGGGASRPQERRRRRRQACARADRAAFLYPELPLDRA